MTAQHLACFGGSGVLAMVTTFGITDMIMCRDYGAALVYGAAFYGLAALIAGVGFVQ